MSKKKILLALCCLLCAAVWYKLFYKSYHQNSVVQNADCIIAVDVKKITNTALWDLLKHPSRWSFSPATTKKKEQISWKDVVVIPDYIFIFHVKNQPASIWYTLFEIKDTNMLKKGLSSYEFIEVNSKANSKTFYSKKYAASVVSFNNQILLTNAPAAAMIETKAVAKSMFEEKKFVSRQLLKSNIDAGSHVSITLLKNNFLAEDAVAKINFDENGMTIKGNFTAEQAFSFAESKFNYTNGSLLSLSFVQPPPALYNLINDSAKAKLSVALSLNIDSLLLPGNKIYQLEVAGFKTRADSAVSYEYDDNFVQTKKLVINNIDEPAFNFSIEGKDPEKIFNYFLDNNKLEKTGTAYIFTAMPFVKSFCKINEHNLQITSANFLPSSGEKQVSAILFFHFFIEKIPPALLRFLPVDIVDKSKNLSEVNFIIQNKNRVNYVSGSILKRNKNVPVFAF